MRDLTGHAIQSNVTGCRQMFQEAFLLQCVYHYGLVDFPDVVFFCAQFTPILGSGCTSKPRLHAIDNESE